MQGIESSRQTCYLTLIMCSSGFIYIESSISTDSDLPGRWSYLSALAVSLSTRALRDLMTSYCFKMLCFYVIILIYIF